MMKFAAAGADKRPIIETNIEEKAMLNTIKATLLPSGMLTFDEALLLDHPIPVLVTLLEERPATHAKPIQTGIENPLDWPLTDEEREVWDEFPKFRAEHPVHFGSLEAEA
jgi:hypothetical protein